MDIPDYVKALSHQDLYDYLISLSEARVAAIKRVEAWDYLTFEKAVAHCLAYPNTKLSRIAAKDCLVMAEVAGPFAPYLKKWPRERILSIAAPTPEARFAIMKVLKSSPEEEVYAAAADVADPQKRGDLLDEVAVWYTALQHAYQG